MPRKRKPNIYQTHITLLVRLNIAAIRIQFPHLRCPVDPARFGMLPPYSRIAATVQLLKKAPTLRKNYSFALETLFTCSNLGLKIRSDGTLTASSALVYIRLQNAGDKIRIRGRNVHPSMVDRKFQELLPIEKWSINPLHRENRSRESESRLFRRGPHATKENLAPTITLAGIQHVLASSVRTPIKIARRRQVCRHQLRFFRGY